MATESRAKVPARFTLFQDLPTELRIHIWEDALPDEIKPALYSYKPGCWKPRQMTESEYNYDPSNADNNWLIEFNHRMLGDAPLNIPLLWVNSEARDVVVAWAAKQGLEMRESEGEDKRIRGPVPMRPFHPEQDALYVSLDDWDGFMNEVLELPFTLGWDQMDRQFGTQCEVYKVAVPETLFRERDAAWRSLPELFQPCPLVKEVYLVHDPQPDPAADASLSSSGSVSVQKRYEIVKKAEELELVWDPEGQVWLEHAAEAGSLDQFVHQAAEELLQELTNYHIQEFNIRSIHAVGQ
ncbi:hypothetical protein CkaCkLH20_03295 [Colletotrichum karsti]|uniref:2EXR domain-containing protein n=1 Tax=Colletotrichum karsti TaxID=1095194 RepID=A0A9P6LNZ4_9PEZI|nr:uncharacterized protein CkaCkLH20_03295 [Colletotrichum karsti]KAF9879062.1 hypothetical protein CkaCkLH20_03295 [Colletotrichum karsti]